MQQPDMLLNLNEHFVHSFICAFPMNCFSEFFIFFSLGCQLVGGDQNSGLMAATSSLL